MNVIRPPFGPIESTLSRRAVADRQRGPHVASRPVTTELSNAGLRQLYTAAQSDRAARIEGLKAQIKSGEYRPNLEVVAERLLADFGGGR